MAQCAVPGDRPPKLPDVTAGVGACVPSLLVRRKCGCCQSSRRRGCALTEPLINYDLNVADIAEVWRRGSVVGSWLLDLTAMAQQGGN